jgi:hypothetical protein
MIDVLLVFVFTVGKIVARRLHLNQTLTMPKLMPPLALAGQAPAIPG